ncbi:ATP-dependent RNA helicase RhlB [Streptomyces violaceorubidus]
MDRTGEAAVSKSGGVARPDCPWAASPSLRRTRTLAQFKDGQVTALVATNVAARGIHVDNLDLVVNVDPPGDHKDYLHRGGRTAGPASPAASSPW